MSYTRLDALVDYLTKYYVEDGEGDPDALQIVFLTDANILKYTGIYIKDLEYDKLETVYKIAMNKESDFTQGDVKTRSQAK